MADGELALLQHRTKLFLANVPALSAELFRQLALQRFGRLRAIRVEPAAPLAEMVAMALEEEAGAEEEGESEARGVPGVCCECQTRKPPLRSVQASLTCCCHNELPPAPRR